MSEEFEEVLRIVACLVFERVQNHSFMDRAFEKAMSEELTDREINHEAHKKIFDERKGKYKFIDLWFPDQQCFAKLKSRKYITRAEINELKEDEVVTGMEGMIINFYNGVTFRHSNSGRVKESDFDPLSSLSLTSEHQRHKSSRMTLPHLSGSTGRLSEMTDHSSRPKTFHHRYPLSVLPINSDKGSYRNANKIFSISCAAFFLSEGVRKEFATIFNDLLEAMKLDKIEIPSKFLDGPNLKTPDGELAGILQKAFADRRRSKNRKDKSNKSSRNPSGDEQDSELHYVGFNDDAEQ